MPIQQITPDNYRWNVPFNVATERNADPADPENLTFQDLNGAITLAGTGEENALELDYPYTLICLIGNDTENATVTIKSRQEISRSRPDDDTTVSEVSITNERINLPAGNFVLVPLSNLYQMVGSGPTDNQFEGKVVIHSDEIIKIRVIGQLGWGNPQVL